MTAAPAGRRSRPRRIPARPSRPAQAEAAAAPGARGWTPASPSPCWTGVTGSGKTEVYFEAVAAALAAGRQVLVLLPEIALSAQWLERFARRFGTPPVQWHSDLKSPRAAAGLASGRRGARAGGGRRPLGPVPALSRAGADRGRRGARGRLQAGGRSDLPRPRHGGVCAPATAACPSCWPSATPSLESVVNVQAGKYGELRLPDPPRRRPDCPPSSWSTCAASRRGAIPGSAASWLSPPLLAALEQTLAEGAQALLYLNRRGYAPLTPLPRLRPPLRVPGLLGLAGRAPLPRPAGLPPLRLRHARARALPRLRRGRRADAHRPRASSAWPRKWRRASRRRAARSCPPTTSTGRPPRAS